MSAPYYVYVSRTRAHTHADKRPRAMRSACASAAFSRAMHVLQPRRSGAFSVALTTVPLRVRRGLVRAYISKPVVTAPPRRYLSHASGADFYRRGDSRGKFIKSPARSSAGASCAFTGIRGTRVFSLFTSICTSYVCQWRKRGVLARFRASLTATTVS